MEAASETLQKNSLLYWFPKIEHLDMMPKTEIYMIPGITSGRMRLNMRKIGYIAKKLGYPLFCRTDLASSKELWGKASFIPSAEWLKGNIERLLSHNRMRGKDFRALVFREYIPLYKRFEAFWGRMPICVERKYYIKNGEVVCRHPYWTRDEIQYPTSIHWKDFLKEMNVECKGEVDKLMRYSKRIADIFRDDGGWRIDYAKTDNGPWILVDMNVADDLPHDSCVEREAYGYV